MPQAILFVCTGGTCEESTREDIKNSSLLVLPPLFSSRGVVYSVFSAVRTQEKPRIPVVYDKYVPRNEANEKRWDGVYLSGF